MSIDSIDTLIDLLRDLRLTELGKVEEAARSVGPTNADPKSFTRQLVAQGQITHFQANELFQGRGAQLVLGKYCLLEPLGEGGMGHVFKARHRLMNRIVALKLIRQELLQSQNAVARFRREIQIVAKLSHPNIIAAFDAEQDGGRHFLVMEYCEGETLGRLVQRTGPIPVDKACDYVRQAAWGLQHAFEQGLMHRDVKPENLLLTGETVKILDLGLARLLVQDDDKSVTEITQENVVVGTPDFLAPEQARDSRKADVRSDAYSLGCTLYYLLAGQVPFPGGTAMEKMLRHEIEEPAPLESLRPETPSAVVEIVRRLMAKDPAARFDSPAGLAQALEPLVHETRKRATIIGQRGSAKLADTVDAQGLPQVRSPQTEQLAPARRRSKKATWALLGAAVVLFGVLAFVLLDPLIDRSEKPKATPRSGGREKQINQVPRQTDRRLAEWIIQKGGRVHVSLDNAPIWHSKITALPDRPFEITGIELRGWHAGRPEITNADVARFRDLKKLKVLLLETSRVDHRALEHLIVLRSLRELSLRRARLFDNDVAALGKLQELRTLNLSFTKVTGDCLQHLESLPHLTTLNLQVTRFSNRGLEQLRRLKSLRELYVTVSFRDRQRQDDLKHLQDLNLTKLDLESYQLTSEGAPYLTGMRKLRALHLGTPLLNDKGLASVAANLTHLTELGLNCNSMTDDGIAALKHVKNLTRLSLTGKSIGDAAVQHLSGLTQLRELELNGTSVGDAGLQHVTLLQNLVRIELAKTKVTNHGLEHLKGVKQLRSVDARDTEVTQEGADSLQKVLPNCHVKLTND